MFVHQGITEPLGVTAFGSHTLGVEPDRATIAFALIHIADRPEDAFTEVETMRAAVAAVFTRYKLAPAEVTTSRVSMELAAEGYGKDRKILGYRAQVDYEVVSRDLPAVSPLVVDLVRAGARAIKSVRYASSNLRELRARARELAFASARVKAEGYARAAGLRLGRVLHIEDVNPDVLTRGGHGPDVDLTTHDEIGGGSPGSITVAGAVMVCFSLVDP